MKQPLDSPLQPDIPNSTIARITRPIESISIVLIIIGILFKLQSWPFAAEILIGGLIGLSICYIVLFPIRLAGLRKPLGLTAFILFLIAGFCLGILLSLSPLSNLFLIYFMDPDDLPSSYFMVYDAIQYFAIAGIALTFLYSWYHRQGSKDTLHYAIASWLWPRQMIVLIWVLWGVIR